MDYNNIIKNVNIYGIEESIRGAKFPMSVNIDKLNCELTEGIKKLGKSNIGEGHDNWLNGVVVQFDLTFTIKAWTEMERYHFMDFISSQSTMHRITKFDLNDSYIEYVDPEIVSIMRRKVGEYNNAELLINNTSLDENIKQSFIEAQKKRYLEILYSNPCGMKLTARMTTNYRQLKTIYKQRRNHRLPEWQMFCNWIETLPMSNLITSKNERV